MNHAKENVRNAAVKILVDTQKQTGQLIESDFGELPEKISIWAWEKVKKVERDQQKEQQLNKDVLQAKILNLQIEPATTFGKMSSDSFEKFK